MRVRRIAWVWHGRCARVRERLVLGMWLVIRMAISPKCENFPILTQIIFLDVNALWNTSRNSCIKFAVFDSSEGRACQKWYSFRVIWRLIRLPWCQHSIVNLIIIDWHESLLLLTLALASGSLANLLNRFLRACKVWIMIHLGQEAFLVDGIVWWERKLFLLGLWLDAYRRKCHILTS